MTQIDKRNTEHDHHDDLSPHPIPGCFEVGHRSFQLVIRYNLQVKPIAAEIGLIGQLRGRRPDRN